MNQTAQKLGLTHSHFTNASGWPDPDLHMSCRDIAMLAWHIIHDFPQYYHYDAEKTFKYNNIEQGNRNPLVQHGTADGLKTGHTEAGGYGLVASTLRNGRRVILVLNGMTSMHERSEEGERLMDWAFTNFEDVTLFSADAAIDHAPVWLGTSQTVPLVAGRRPCADHAAQLAPDRPGKTELPVADPRPGRERHRGRQAGRLRPGRAGRAVVAADRRGSAEA